MPWSVQSLQWWPFPWCSVCHWTPAPVHIDNKISDLAQILESRPQNFIFFPPHKKMNSMTHIHGTALRHLPIILCIVYCMEMLSPLVRTTTYHHYKTTFMFCIHVWTQLSSHQTNFKAMGLDHRLYKRRSGQIPAVIPNKRKFTVTPWWAQPQEGITTIGMIVFSPLSSHWR